MSEVSLKLNWRKFPLFDKSTLTENLPEILALENDLVALRADGGHLFIGDAAGIIYQLDRSLQVISKQKIFRGQIFGISNTIYASGARKQFIITIGDDSVRSEDGVSFVVKVFVVPDMSRPVQQFAVKDQLPKGAGITSFDVLSDGSKVVLGFTTGTVLLYEGEFLKESTGRPPLPQALLQAHTSLCSGLHFCETSGSPAYKAGAGDRSVHLFAVFETPEIVPKDSKRGQNQGGVIVFDITRRSAPNILDDIGAPLGCTSFIKNSSELVIGRKEGILNYSVDGRGGAVAFESPKQRLNTVGRYLVLSFSDEKTGRTSVTIYDLRNKFIAASLLLPSGESLRFCSTDDRAVFVITSSGAILQFLEKDTNGKLEVLLKKSLYTLAITLAAEEQCDAAEIVKLYQKYAEHLYDNEDYDAAVEQYCNTIGFIQPSHVIRKFLDPQRLVNLITYLEKIQEKGFGTRDTTDLLLTCLTKLNDIDKILHFTELDVPLPEASVEGVSVAPNMQASSVVPGDTGPTAQTNSPFNADAAIFTLLLAGLPGIALRVAWRNLKHDAFIDIHTTEKDVFNVSLSVSASEEKCVAHSIQEKEATEFYPSVETAIAYLTALVFHIPMGDILHLILKYGPRILAKKPDLFTALLVQLCKGDVESFRPSNTVGGSTIHVEKIPVEPILCLFTGKEDYIRKLLEGVFLTKSSEGVYSLNLSANGGKSLSSVVTLAFLDAYLKLLHTCHSQLEATKQIGTSEEMRAIRRSLNATEDLILSFLDLNDIPPDDMKVMLLFHAFGFKKGQVFLLEKQNSPEALLQKYMEIGDNKGLFRLLRKEGRKKSEIAPIILTYFVVSAGISQGKSVPNSPTRNNRAKDSDDEDDDDDDAEDSADEDAKWDNVLEALSIIERDGILSPMEVINILSQNPQLPLGVCFDYSKRTLRSIDADIESTSALVENMRGAVLQAEADAEAIRKKEALYKFRGVDRRQHISQKKTQSRYDDDEDDEEDDVRGQAPYNEVQVSLAVAEREQAAERKKWEDIRQAQVERSGDHEAFFNELEQSSSGDGFSTIAAYFGKTIIM